MRALKDAGPEPTHTQESCSFLSVVAEHCGAEAVERMCAELGGTRIGIPAHPQPHHRLCMLLGVETVAKIVTIFGYGQVDVPLGRFAQTPQRTAQFLKLEAQGLSSTAIARALGCSARTITRYRRRLRHPEGK